MKVQDLHSIFLEFPSVNTDTRKIKKNDIFFALKGDNFNGNTYTQQALDNGATDYITKPFRTGELMARIRSSLRQSFSDENDPVIICGNLKIDLLSRAVYKDDIQIKLTSTEYNLLALFAKNIGKVLTHQFILKEIWGPGYQLETQYSRVYVAQIRKKIEDDPNKPQHIITESGVGYRFK